MNQIKKEADENAIMERLEKEDKKQVLGSIDEFYDINLNPCFWILANRNTNNLCEMKLLRKEPMSRSVFHFTFTFLEVEQEDNDDFEDKPTPE